MKIGAQFYTVREFCKDLDSFAETLKKVADIGYTTVQISGTCAFEGQWLKEQLDKNGLQCVLTHTPAKQLQEDLEQVCIDHNTFGCMNVGLGYCDFKKEDPEITYPRFLETYKPVAQKLKENGKYFMYHNHDGEFRRYNGKLILDRMAEDFTADEMGFTLDTYWVQKGGANPVDYINKLAGRLPCIHLKDYDYEGKMSVVGEGNINFDAVIAAAEKAGTQYLLVEQDDCNGEDPFACLKRSYDNLRAMGLK